MRRVNWVAVLNDITKSKHDIIVTLPSTVQWHEFEKELRRVANYQHDLSLEIPFFPKGVYKGDKCYVVYENRIMGWNEIVDFTEENNDEDGFAVTHKYIKRSGPFHKIEEYIPYADFQGFRYFNLDEYKELQSSKN